MKVLVLAALLMAGLASPALAGSCPLHMKAIDAALKSNPQISEVQLKEVRALRAEGEKLHKSGQHGSSVATLNVAKKILGIK